MLTRILDREEALKEDFPLEGSAYDEEDEDDEWAGDDNAWTGEEEHQEEEDVRDESSAYLEFLNEEAQKFKKLEDNDSDDELGEESLLETPLDKIEPYQLFKNALMSMLAFACSFSGIQMLMKIELQAEQPQLYESLTTILSPEEQSIVQSVVHQADAIAAQAAAAAQAEAHAPNGGA